MAGNKGEQSARINGSPAAWKFHKDLEKRNVGVNEVEMDAWNRAANRVVKKGYNRPKKNASLMKVCREIKDWMREKKIIVAIK